MRQCFILAFLFAGMGAAAAAHAAEPPPVLACPAETEQAGAAEVLDARSIKLGDGRMLRLAGIEPFDFYLTDAADAGVKQQSRIGDLIAGGDVRFGLVANEPDRYGRLPALVLSGGALMQEELAREGLAIAYMTGDPLPCFDRILAAEADARAAHRGYWGDQALPQASPAALAAWIGRFAIFEGRVLSVGNRPTRSYLNFGRRWSEDATVEIAARDLEAFGGEAKIAALAGHRVRVRGFLEEKGGPAMVLRSPMQLEALDPVRETLGKAP
jgi:endonuclease YncB( thermonuclease family)